MRHSPSVPRVTSTRSSCASATSALTSGSTVALTLGHSVWRVAFSSVFLSNLFTVIPLLPTSRFARTFVVKICQDFCRARRDQALGGHPRGGAGPHSAYRAVFVDKFARFWPVGGPIRPSHGEGHGHGTGREDNGRGHGACESELRLGELALQHRVRDEARRAACRRCRRYRALRRHAD